MIDPQRIYKVPPAQKFHTIPCVARLLICLFACDLSADTPPIRVSVQAKCSDCNEPRMISALSHEFRKLDGVSVTDTQPALKIGCVVMVATTDSASHVTVGYASSVAITDIDGRLINNWLFIETTIDTLAHRIAVAVDGNVIEQMRRDAQPSSSP